MKKNSSLRMIVEAGIMIALAFVLSTIKIYKMPQGGSVTAGSMIPILLFALRWGAAKGIVVGALYGVLQFIMEPYMVHIFQVILDYPLAFGALGIAGFSRHLAQRYPSKKRLLIFAFSTLALLGRMIFHVLSGVVFFAELAGAENPWIFSIAYNGSYMIVELIVALLILSIILDPINKAVPIE